MNTSKEAALPAYSVLMSTYAADEASWLLVSLESMATQTLPPAEIVLVIDGPVADELLDAMDSFDKKYPGMLIRVPLEKNGGLGPALNAGLAYCASDVIVRMDADDISLPERCEVQLAKLSEGYDMVGCNAVEFSRDINNPDSVREMPETHDEITRFSKKRAPFVHPAFVVRKAALEAVGGYRNVSYAEDFDLFIRLLKAGYKGYNIQKELFAVRVDTNVYRRRGGFSYLCDMLSFNVLELREGWFGIGDFIVRSGANIVVTLVPNSVRDAIYKKLLRRHS